MLMRAGLALLLGLLGGTFAASARVQPAAEETRLGGRLELAELIRAEQGRVDELQARVDELAAQVAAHEQRGADENTQTALRERIDEVAAPAGMTEVQGPGVVAALDDSTRKPDPEAGDDPNNFIIHEEQLHSVMNALWAGGAEAMSVNGQRILSTTAVRCVGSVLLLHGHQYSPPYVVRVVGDAEDLQQALAEDPSVQRFAMAATEFDLGFDVEVVDELTLPAYDGVASMQVASPTEATSG